MALPFWVTYGMLGSWPPAAAVAAAGAVCFLLPFDRWLEDRFRPSRKME